MDVITYPCPIPHSCNLSALRWRHNDHAGVSNHQPHGCSLNRLFRRKSKKTSKLRVTGLCAGNSPGTGEFPAQMASDAENVSIWWRHHGFQIWGLFANNMRRWQRWSGVSLGYRSDPDVLSDIQLLLQTVGTNTRRPFTTVCRKLAGF